LNGWASVIFMSAASKACQQLVKHVSSGRGVEAAGDEDFAGPCPTVVLTRLSLPPDLGSAGQAKPPLADALGTLTGKISTHTDGKAYDRILVSEAIAKGLSIARARCGAAAAANGSIMGATFPPGGWLLRNVTLRGAGAAPGAALAPGAANLGPTLALGEGAAGGALRAGGIATSR
jgi:hypothetical protein